ncbi:hypothetical protein [Tardiphaga sp.]|uniref:hypothetical protein n=1 Tax=Tardiphaga sp. TaxID=1926292 RepID=UPI00352B0514
MILLVKAFGRLSETWKVTLFVTGLILILFAGYLLTIAMPVALTAVASGRGITLSMLEIGSNKTCEHAHEILANSTANNEIALYNNLVEKLLKNSESALAYGNSQTGDASLRLVDRSKTVLEMANQARVEQDAISKGRRDVFDAVNHGCLQRDPGYQKGLTWEVTWLVLGSMFLLLAFAYCAIVRVCRAIEVQAAKQSPT